MSGQHMVMTTFLADGIIMLPVDMGEIASSEIVTQRIFDLLFFSEFRRTWKPARLSNLKAHGSNAYTPVIRMD